MATQQQPSNQDAVVVDLTFLDNEANEDDYHTVHATTGTSNKRRNDDEVVVVAVVQEDGGTTHQATRDKTFSVAPNSNVIDLSTTTESAHSISSVDQNGGGFSPPSPNPTNRVATLISTSQRRSSKRSRRTSIAKTTKDTRNEEEVDVIDVDATYGFSANQGSNVAAAARSVATASAISVDRFLANAEKLTPEDEYRKELGPLRMQFVTQFSPPHSFEQKAQSAKAANAKDIQKLYHELTEYQLNLPVQPNSSIFVRVMESRTDLIRVLITGPVDTPYANGMFFFDCYLYDYPKRPPEVRFLTTKGGQVRFNPNLYADGKVCLSLLGTWSGPGWIPGQSTLLQVLVSIQGLIFVSEPYFNEPGFEGARTRKSAIAASDLYNSKIRWHSAVEAIMMPLRYVTSGSANTSTGKTNNNAASRPNTATVTTANGLFYSEFHSVIERHYQLQTDCVLQQMEEWKKLDSSNTKLGPIIEAIRSMLLTLCPLPERKKEKQSSTTIANNNGNNEKVPLLGIGGKKTTKQGDSANKPGAKKRKPGEIRIHKDIAELDGGKVATISFPNPNDPTAFDVTISPDSGFWKGATYHFTFTIPADYPHSPPKVKCNTKIQHPNIDLQGKVCLNILREDWKPVLDINAVIYGLINLFYVVP